MRRAGRAGGPGPPAAGRACGRPAAATGPAAPGWAGADANGAADGGELEELAKRCCPGPNTPRTLSPCHT